MKLKDRCTDSGTNEVANRLADLMHKNHYQPCVVNVTEFSPRHSWHSGKMNNDEFITYFRAWKLDPTVANKRATQRNIHNNLKPIGKRGSEKITWIDVGSISWDVIRILPGAFCKYFPFMFTQCLYILL